MQGSDHQTMIGQAWTGRHVVLLHCFKNNAFHQMYSSYHAPLEPPSKNCAETLSQLISIGYTVYQITSLPGNQLQYLLVL